MQSQMWGAESESWGVIWTQRASRGHSLAVSVGMGSEFKGQHVRLHQFTAPPPNTLGPASP